MLFSVWVVDLEGTSFWGFFAKKVCFFLVPWKVADVFVSKSDSPGQIVNGDYGFG